jgi:hypothetical protein
MRRRAWQNPLYSMLVTVSSDGVATATLPAHCINQPDLVRGLLRSATNLATASANLAQEQFVATGAVYPNVAFKVPTTDVHTGMTVAISPLNKLRQALQQFLNTLLSAARGAIQQSNVKVADLMADIKSACALRAPAKLLACMPCCHLLLCCHRPVNEPSAGLPARSMPRKLLTGRAKMISSPQLEDKHGVHLALLLLHHINLWCSGSRRPCQVAGGVFGGRLEEGGQEMGKAKVAHIAAPCCIRKVRFLYQDCIVQCCAACCVLQCSCPCRCLGLNTLKNTCARFQCDISSSHSHSA